MEETKERGGGEKRKEEKKEIGGRRDRRSSMGNGLKIDFFVFFSLPSFFFLCHLFGAE